LELISSEISVMITIKERVKRAIRVKRVKRAIRVKRVKRAIRVEESEASDQSGREWIRVKRMEENGRE
jgi:hypothetical protein